MFLTLIIILIYKVLYIHSLDVAYNFYITLFYQITLLSYIMFKLEISHYDSFYSLNVQK